MVKKKLHSHNVYRVWNWNVFDDDGALPAMLVIGWIAAAIWTMVLFVAGVGVTLGDTAVELSPWFHVIYAYNLLLLLIWAFYAWATGKLYTDKR